MWSFEDRLSPILAGRRKPALAALSSRSDSARGHSQLSREVKICSQLPLDGLDEALHHNTRKCLVRDLCDFMESRMQLVNALS